MSPPVLGTYPWIPKVNADPDVQTSLTAFTLGILNAYQGTQAPILVQRGERQTTADLINKLPVEVGDPLFQAVTGGVEYREVGNLMLPLATPDPFADAVKALVTRMQSNAWTGWGKQPLKIATAASLVDEIAVITAILAGETTASADNYLDGDSLDKGYRFFMQSRPCDPMGLASGLNSNLLTSTGSSSLGTDAGGNLDRAAPLTLANIDRVRNVVRRQKSPMGVKMPDGTVTQGFYDLRWAATLVSTGQEFIARRYFDDQGAANDMVNENATDTEKSAATGSKVFPTPNTAKQYKIEVIASPLLPDDGTWYPICVTPTITTFPWITLTQVPARQVEFAGPQQSLGGGNGAGDLRWIIDDMTSEGYKHGTKSLPKGYVGIQAMKYVAAALLWHMQMFKCKAA